MRKEETRKFEGFTNPNTTGVPDEYFDRVSPRLNGSEVKLMNYLMRRTYGFKKGSDTVSISQMLHGIVRRDGTRLDLGSGLSKGSIIKTLNSLEEKGLIIRRRQFDFNGGFLATSYEVNRKPDTLGTKSDQGSKPLGAKSDQGGLGVNNDQPLVRNSPKPLVQKLTIQDTDNNIQLDNNVNVSNTPKKKRKSGIKDLPNISIDEDHRRLIAQDIVDELGDDHSWRFFFLVAGKVPERIIRRTLAEATSGSARNPAKVFTSRMHKYARERYKSEHEKELQASRYALGRKMKGGANV